MKACRAYMKPMARIITLGGMSLLFINAVNYYFCMATISSHTATGLMLTVSGAMLLRAIRLKETK